MAIGCVGPRESQWQALFTISDAKNQTHAQAVSAQAVRTQTTSSMTKHEDLCLEAVSLISQSISFGCSTGNLNESEWIERYNRVYIARIHAY